MSQLAVFDVVKNGQPFANPVAGPIAGAGVATASGVSKTTNDLAAVDAALVMDPTNPVLLQEKADLEGLLDRFAVLGGASPDPGLPEYYTLAAGVGLSFAAMLTHTNYFSGVDASPPAGLSGGSITFINVLAATSSMKRVAKELGETPVDDPCKTVNDLLGSVLGKLAEFLGPLIDFLNQLVNAALTAANFILLLDNIINNIWQILNLEVQRLKDYLKDLADWAISSLLNSIIGDPCLAAVIGAIGTPALQQAIQEAPIIPS